MQFSTFQKFAAFGLIILFCTFICAPSIIMCLSKPQVWSETEKRALSPLPELPRQVSDIVPFFSSIDIYLNDHFGFRDYFITRYQRELQKRFDKESVHKRVIKGIDGWYFFNDFDLLKDFLGLIPLTDLHLQRFIDRQYQKKKWLRSHGIEFIYAIAPNKQSIYPQFLMQNALKLKGISRYEQFERYVEGNFPEHMIDLHSLLKGASEKQTPLYYKNDSHWNKLAAYMVFRELMEKVSSLFPDEKFRTDFEFVADETGIGGNTGEGGDLVRIIRQPRLPETYPQIQHFRRCDGRLYAIPSELSNITYKRGRPSFLKKCPSRNLKIVIFRDSFFEPLEPFFSENFAETHYLWKKFDQNNIEELLNYSKPDVVLEVVVERHAFDHILNDVQQ